MDDKEAKKRAAVAKFIKFSEYAMVHGIRGLRYWCVQEADEYEGKLQHCHKIFSEMTGDKQTMIDAVSTLDETVYHMMYLWTQNFCGANGYKVNPEFAEEIDLNYMSYINKVEKSVNAKQSHAPGFDGQGGGR